MSTLAEKIAILRPNPHWDKLPLFDRKGWKTVRFGEVVENLNETCDPEEAGLARFIGMEHLEPGSLYIRSWGNVADSTTFTRRCRAGQVLFGKRRAYQRKVALAEFDAVVSGDIYVLAPTGDRLLPELLPFLCLSERFFQHAVGTSAGSLSPRTNWSSLATFEFALPPLDQQRRIAEILWAVDEAIQTANSLCEQVNSSCNVFFDEALGEGINKKPNSLRKLGDALAGIVAGKSPKSSSAPATENEYGVLKVSAVGDGEYCEAENKALLDPEDFDADYEVKPGMILVTRCNALLSGIGRACLVEHSRSGLMLSDKTLQLMPESRVIDRDFLLHGLRREPYRGFVERSANGTEAKNITQETLRAAPFWIPPLDEQKRIVAELGRFSNALKATATNATRHGTLRVSLINTFIE
jgi:type I restriction enzyme S subunit